MEAERNDSLRLLTRRQWLTATGAAMTVAATSGCMARATDARGSPSELRLRLLGSATLPYRLQFKGTTVGGLSGLDHDPQTGLWYAISDDVPARFYVLRIPLSDRGLGEPELLDVIGMRQANGLPYPRRGPGRLVVDPESIRYRTDVRTLLWTSEGDRRRGVDPSLREMTPDGRSLREFKLPAHFSVDLDRDSGPRHNGSFEGLALTPDGHGAWVAMERPLLQDGATADTDSRGAPCRFTLFDLQSGEAIRQIGYQPERITRIPIPGLAFADNGVTEILMCDAHRMLVLERGFSMGAGVTLRLFLIDVRQPDDTLALATLRSDQVELARKTLIADFDGLGLERLDNTEGMAWGPRLAGAGGRPGERTLVFVSDDNFNPLQITQFAAFALTEPETA